MNSKKNFKIFFLLSFIGFFNSLNAQENFSNHVTVHESSNNPWPSFNIYSYGGLQSYGAGHHPVFNSIRGNWINNAPSFVKAGDILGAVGFSGRNENPNDIVQNIRIQAYALSDYTNGNYANRLDFQVGGNTTCCGETRMSINGVTGNVGIGTIEPSEKLEINGNILLNSFNVGNENGLFFRNGFSSVNKYNMSILAFDHNNDSSPDGLSVNGWDGISFSTGSNIRNERMKITQTGNVGIGTANPDSKLTVKGSIHAEEVKVDLAIAPDYVFEKYYDGYSTLKSEYKMPTLQEVEAYTKENKHLPEVPSAQEIKENGLKLGEMNAILLQKVEELTLYLIEQNKEIEKLKTKVDELSKK